MWKLFRCYVSGRHEYHVSCEPGAIYLQCPHCGRRSSGWAIDDRPGQTSTPRSGGMQNTRLRHAADGSGPGAR